MEKIVNKYSNLKETPSDINEHLETLYNYASKCDHITEMGVRDIVSTWALLASNPKKMVSYDIVLPPKDNLDELLSLTKEYKLNFTFNLEDVLKTDIEQTDLLFIDTLHTYDQLRQEFALHAKKVNKYIILHDTELYKVVGESPGSTGLQLAITQFLDENQNWKVLEIKNNNNGLLVLANTDNLS